MSESKEDKRRRRLRKSKRSSHIVYIRSSSSTSSQTSNYTAIKLQTFSLPVTSYRHLPFLEYWTASKRHDAPLPSPPCWLRGRLHAMPGLSTGPLFRSSCSEHHHNPCLVSVHLPRAPGVPRPAFGGICTAWHSLQGLNFRRRYARRQHGATS